MATIKGGTKLEAQLGEIAKKLDKGVLLSVGFLENATYPDGTPVAQIAAIQNFGAPAAGIPPRPFFSNMVADKQDGWGDAVAKNLVATNYDATKTLERMGEGIEGQLKQSIRDTNEPPLAPATVKAKGFDKPLVDTGHMLNSTGYKVDET